MVIVLADILPGSLGTCPGKRLSPHANHFWRTVTPSCIEYGYNIFFSAFQPGIQHRPNYDDVMRKRDGYCSLLIPLVFNRSRADQVQKSSGFLIFNAWEFSCSLICLSSCREVWNTLNELRMLGISFHLAQFKGFSFFRTFV